MSGCLFSPFLSFFFTACLQFEEASGGRGGKEGVGGWGSVNPRLPFGAQVFPSQDLSGARLFEVLKVSNAAGGVGVS